MYSLCIFINIRDCRHYCFHFPRVKKKRSKLQQCYHSVYLSTSGIVNNFSPVFQGVTSQQIYRGFDLCDIHGKRPYNTFGLVFMSKFLAFFACKLYYQKPRQRYNPQSLKTPKMGTPPLFNLYCFVVLFRITEVVIKYLSS